MENQQVQPTTVDTRVQGGATKKTKKREFKNRKTFSLKAMEALVDKVGFLKNKYEALAINAQEKLGYHYNEILNILLFHKYVKGNKKLFNMYKKVKDAINKGYEFEKKKLKENTMKNKSNKTHFAINKNTNKILESWNYEGYEHDELKKYKDEYFTKDVKRNYPFLNENDIVVVSAKNLEKRELNESNKKDWQKYNYSHFALLKETNHILYGFDYSNVDSEELKENKNHYFLNVISEEYGNEISPKDVVVVKSSKLDKLGIKDYLNESNWVGLINEAYCGDNKEEMIDEVSRDRNLINSLVNGDIYEYEVPSWALGALINGDYSGLSDEDEQKINNFVQSVVSEVGNANFYGGEEEDRIGFSGFNDIDKLGSEVYKVYVRKSNIEESTAMSNAFPVGNQPTGGYPVANPKKKGKKRGFDLKSGQNMFDPPSNDLGGLDDFYSRWSNPAFKSNKGPVKVDKAGRVKVNTKTHYSGTNKSVKGVNENYNLVDLDALMNDEIVEYKKISAPSNVFKSPKIELIRENNRDSITDFILKHQGRELPEVYNKRQLDTLALKTLNEYYNRLVQRLGLLAEEKRPDALVRIDALKKQSQKDTNNYYKKDASNKTTTMLVQKGEGDGLEYDKDSRERKDIPMYKFQSDHQKQYLEKGHRGLEDFVPDNNPNGEVDPVWEARKKALMSTQEVGAKAYDSAKKRIQYKKDNKLGTGRNRAVLNQETLPKVDKADELLKENTFTVINEENILNQIQSYYIDDENRKKPVIFDSNNIVEMQKINENKLSGCKELIYKGLGQTLSEDFKNRVLNKKLLYSPDSKKVFLV